MSSRLELFVLGTLAAACVSGCAAAGTAAAPSPGSPVSPLMPARTQAHKGFISFYKCPDHGALKYVADYNNGNVNIFTGPFAGQAPCGRIGSGLSLPWGLYVDRATHDLYVANVGRHNIVVFHRGARTPYATYVDPTGQDPTDVVLTSDGTVVANNFTDEALTEGPSLSTWHASSSGGGFVGNFPLAGGGIGQFITAAPDGTIYFDKFNQGLSHGHVGSSIGSLWSVSCPSGACGAQTRIGPRFSLVGPGGLAFGTDGDLRIGEGGVASVDTVELPNFPPRRLSAMGYPTAIAVNEFDHHVFVADGEFNQAEEYDYPSGKLVGIVAGNPGGGTFGIAVDPDR